MHAAAIGLAVSAIVFAGGIVGLNMDRILPPGHRSKDTQEVVRLGTGMLSVLASLVLGLLIATVKTSFDATNTAVHLYAADLIVLDETLRDYGDLALPTRRVVRDYTGTLLNDVWPEHGGAPFMVENVQAGAMLEHIRNEIRALPADRVDRQWLVGQALPISTSLLRQRWLLIDIAEPSVKPMTIVILVSWVVPIFVSFGLSAPRNATVGVAFFICALAIGSSIYLVLELDSPFAGTMRVASQPVRPRWRTCYRSRKSIPQSPVVVTAEDLPLKGWPRLLAAQVINPDDLATLATTMQEMTPVDAPAEPIFAPPARPAT